MSNRMPTPVKPSSLAVALLLEEFGVTGPLRSKRVRMSSSHSLWREHDRSWRFIREGFWQVMSHCAT